MQIADEMDYPLERFQPVGARSFLIAENAAKDFNAIDHAIVVVSQGVLVLVLGPEAVALLREAGGFHGDVDKVPVVAFVAVLPDLVSPTGDGSQAVLAKQQLEILARLRGQAGFSNIGDDGVAFGAPGEQLGRDKYEQNKESNELFHEDRLYPIKARQPKLPRAVSILQRFRSGHAHQAESAAAYTGSCCC